MLQGGICYGEKGERERVSGGSRGTARNLKPGGHGGGDVGSKT